MSQWIPNVKGKSITHLGLDSCFQDRPDNKRGFFSSPVMQTRAGVVQKTSRWW